MNFKNKTSAVFCLVLFYMVSLSSASATVTEQQVKKRSGEVKDIYLYLINKQANREKKDAPPHDWARAANLTGRELKQKLDLTNATAAAHGLRHFYKIFLTTPLNDSGFVLAIARMQMACSHPPHYRYTDFNPNALGTSYPNAVLVNNYQPPNGAAFDVTLYSFFVGALTEVPKMQLTAQERQVVWDNLNALHTQIQDIMSWPEGF